MCYSDTYEREKQSSIFDDGISGGRCELPTDSTKAAL